LWQDRIWLINEASKSKNSALYSSAQTSVVFNGSDSGTIYFGSADEIKGATTMFTRFGGSLYDNLIVLKNSEVWLVDGFSPKDFRTYKIADNYGLVAPQTLISCDIGFEVVPGLQKHILIWQADGAVVSFDGNAINTLSEDIKNYFDPTKAECITSGMIDKSTAFYDYSNNEYHWLFASGVGITTLNKEFVYDLKKKKWYEIDRGTGKRLSMGVLCKDTYGKSYIYGSIDTGYMERLEYGNTFDGTSIISTFQTGDISFGGWTHETMIRFLRHVAIAKTETLNVTMTHYGDTITSSTQTATFSLNNATQRIAKPVKSIQWGDNIWHSFHCTVTSTSEVSGYEPMGLGIFYEVIREAMV
jgi:hypothetical protein